MNEIIKRYNIGLSIINNNRGLIAMLKTIYNKISSIINKMMNIMISLRQYKSILLIMKIVIWKAI